MPAGVLVPVHGFAPYLAEALDAVLAQDPAAVVVIDDASDPPLALHADHAGVVTLLRRDTRGGPAVARADGLTALPAAVDLIALCDADDVWEPGKLAAQETALAAHATVGLCFGRAVVVAPDGRPSGERWEEPQAGLHPAGPFAQALYAANPIPTSSVVLRRAAVEAAGGFTGPVEIAEDWELWLRIARAGFDALCLPDARVRYRRHSGGLTADVARLATAQRAVHTAHADLVDPAAARAAIARDDRVLAAERRRARLRRLPAVGGLVRRRDPYRR